MYMQGREFEFIILLIVIAIFMCFFIYEMIKEQKGKEI